LHGGTTGTFFVAASGARHRVGFTEYQYSFLYNHLLTSASDFWERKYTHSVEQQLALLGFVGVPVNGSERTRLDVSADALRSLEEKFSAKTQSLQREFALIHPAAAFDTKQWATENFARTAEFLAEKGIDTVAIATGRERAVLDKLRSESKVPITTLDNLSLPEITALASKACLFVGNDSGIAHIAAAVNTPSVVVFGSSDPNHWRPWTDAPNEVVYHAMPCQPCPGYECKQFDRPHCILNVTTCSVISAVERVLSK
ncbi:MAG TPA: glycosyltransferase family 9 protein, partial [Pyrinomonadaceae bacterium]|nr:glycosyltransferase family 9 protein [Pyrinomonadaceae bacterium]